MTQIQFACQAYQSQSLPLNAQQCINFYVEASPKDSKTIAPVFGCPGLSTFATCGTAPVYDLRMLGSVLYATTGDGIYSITNKGVTTKKASFSPAGRCSVSDNGTQIVVVDGISRWVFAPAGIPNSLSASAITGATSIQLTSIVGISPSDTLNIQLDSGSTFGTTVSSVNVLTSTVTITSPLPGASTSGNAVYDTNVSLLTVTNAAAYPSNTVAFYDQYFVFDRAGTQQFFISGLGDGTSYSGLDYASAEADTSNIMAVTAIHEILVLFKQSSTEFWYDSGALAFPFQRIQSTLLQRGIAAARAYVREDNTVYFLGDDLIFYRLEAFGVNRVSQHAVEAAWSRYSTISDAFCFSYTWGGHKFVNVVFPAQGASWVLDLATGLWHERDSWDSGNNPLSRWRGNCAVSAYGKVLIGDAFSGVVGEIDPSTYTEYGNTMRGLITGPPIQSDRKRMFMSRFELDVESGVGLLDGSTPQIVLDWSDDGARTWTLNVQPRSMGKVGQYGQRLRWLRLGQSRNRTLRLTVTDPVRRNLIGFYLDLKAGMG